MSERSGVTGQTNAVLRRAELQARCEAQRAVLGEYVADIKQRLHSTDSVLGSIRNVVTKPSVLAGGLAFALTTRATASCRVGSKGWPSAE